MRSSPAFLWFLSAVALLALGAALSFGERAEDPAASPPLRGVALATGTHPAVEASPAAVAAVLERVRQGRRELASLDGSHFRESVSAVLLEAGLFEEWARLVEEAGALGLRGNEARFVAAFQAELEVAQEREYPALRRAFVEAVKAQPWAGDLELGAGGDDAKILYLRSTHFSEPGLRRLVKYRLAEPLVRLRFREVRYGDGEPAGEPEAAPIPGQPDGSLVFWTDVGRTVVVAPVLGHR